MKLKDHKFGFKALLATQFLGAFNDNAFKLVIAFVAIDLFVTKSGGSLFLSLAGILFSLPFFLFSTYAGYLADHFSKQKIIVVMKFIEIFVMVLGLFALQSGNIWFILSVLFLMGTQSAFFSPSKYGILPEILSDEELSEGNGLIQMWTYAAIILGQVCGGLLMQVNNEQIYKAAFVFIGVAVVGALTSIYITKVDASGAKRSFEWNFPKEALENIKRIKPERGVFLSILGLMYFGFLGGIFHLNVLLYARKIMGIEHFPLSILLIILAIGIGAGSILAGKLSGKKIEFGFVPLGAIGLSIISIILGFVYYSYFKVAICLFLLGVSAGFYIIPLNAFVQQASPVDRKGQVLATMNILTSLTGLFASVMIFVFKDIIQINSAQIFVFVGILTSVGAVYVCRLLPYAFVRLIVWILTHTIYRIKTVNSDNIPQEGGALLVSNHVAMVDALLILVSIQRPVRFMIGRSAYNAKIFKFLFKLSKVIPIADTDGPKEQIKSLRTATEAIKNGELVCIFAEGQLTKTGNMLKFNKGLERIMKEVDCPIIPIHLDRIWGSIFSYEGGRYYYKLPKVLPYPVTVSFGQPMPPDSKAFEIRNRVKELGAESFQYRLAERITLPEAFWKEAQKHPFKFCVADSSGQKLSYVATLISSVVMAGKLKQHLGDEKNIGILIPPSVGGVLINIATSILNKCPVNLNYTTSPEALDSIVHQCQMKYVVTSRAFVEKVQVKLSCEQIFIEDIVSSITMLDKLTAAIKSFVPFLSYSLIFGSRKNRKIDNLATIMFTSGSTGAPKGVMLTYANITSNLEGLYQVFHMQNNDVLLGVLPFFHSFGFTATIWFPLISGIGAVYHFNPLDAKMIGRLVDKHKATILMSTPTFLSSYTRRCTPEQFKSLRLAVVGAEKLKENVASAFKEKFNIEPMEGYGCTELSPIVSINLPDYSEKGHRQKAYKPNTIGMPLPGVAVRIADQDTGDSKNADESGLLYVKGPNVMRGYLNHEDKTKEVIQEGWYFTGDVAHLDEDGFLTITDRLSRFSKIGGEMVPHIKIEETIHAILNATEQACVVTSIPDEKKGEKLVVLCLKDVDVPSLVEELRKSDLPNLWVPDAQYFQRMDAIPMLGTGKIDLGKVKQIAKESFEKHGS